MILQLLIISKYLNLFKNHEFNPLVRPFMRVTNHLSRFELILPILNRVDSLTFQTFESSGETRTALRTGDRNARDRAILYDLTCTKECMPPHGSWTARLSQGGGGTGR